MCSVLEGLRGKVAVQCFAVSLCECVCARARAERERTTARDRFTFCVSFTRASLDHGCQRDTEPPPPCARPKSPQQRSGNTQTGDSSGPPFRTLDIIGSTEAPPVAAPPSAVRGRSKQVERWRPTSV